VDLVEGSGGVLDVTVDGKLVFSKHRTGDYPKPGEVVVAIKALSRGRR
jgi:selT/selW/selH-like putative selenoprotein